MGWDLDTLCASLLVGSTLVEGSTLTEGEAAGVLAGRTAGGHAVAEVRELTNYRRAAEWLLERFAATPYLSTDLVLGTHQHLLDGLGGDEAGQWKRSANFTFRSDGERQAYVDPAAVPDRMRAWVARFNGVTDRAATTGAAQLYFDFERIHPFADGNGRVGRLLIAYWLHWKASLSFRFHLSDKVAHLDALEAAAEGDLKLLTTFFAERTAPEHG